MRLIMAMDGCADAQVVITAHQLWKVMLRLGYPVAHNFEGQLRRLAQKYYGEPELGLRMDFLSRFSQRPLCIIVPSIQ